jgi:hypothetical protein
MNGVLFEGDGVGNLVWGAVDLCSNCQLVCQREKALVEFSYRHGHQGKRLSGAVVQSADQLMVYEIELKLDVSNIRGNE